MLRLKHDQVWSETIQEACLTSRLWEFCKMYNIGAVMGVDHGGDGGTSPPEFGVGDANPNCPPQILSYRYKNEHSVAFKIRQNPFSARAAPDHAGGTRDVFPHHVVR